MIAGIRYIKSANDESLARDEGVGSNLVMEVVTYKTVQGRQWRMTPATATFFSRQWMQLRAGTCELQRGARVSLRHSSCKSTKDNMCVRPADQITNYQIRRGCGWMMCDPGAGDYHDCFPYQATLSVPKGDS